MEAHYSRYLLNFKQPSGTSRGVLTEKETWFITIRDEARYGIGECGLLRGLSIDDRPDYENQLKWVCKNIHLGLNTLRDALVDFPSIQFGLEQAFLSIAAHTPFELFSSAFTTSAAAIPINGLIWMGEESFMLDQIEQRLAQGFRCIKMKIGAIDVAAELKLLKIIREQFSEKELVLRVDANGAFSPSAAMEVFKKLAELRIHSIEQPIATRQWKAMRELCSKSPVAIALDEELIGINTSKERIGLLHDLRPQYIILKPSLLGGFDACKTWITIAEELGIGWWVTSALESNIGLNAIAQWTYTLDNTIPQGLGTGSLFTNNFKSPLAVENGNLYYRKHLSWQQDIIPQLCT
ncbi:MAG: o-succinylbenzoate synthase [Bacteroidota bacterium]